MKREDCPTSVHSILRWLADPFQGRRSSLVQHDADSFFCEGSVDNEIHDRHQPKRRRFVKRVWRRIPTDQQNVICKDSFDSFPKRFNLPALQRRPKPPSVILNTSAIRWRKQHENFQSQRAFACRFNPIGIHQLLLGLDVYVPQGGGFESAEQL